MLFQIFIDRRKFRMDMIFWGDIKNSRIKIVFKACNMTAKYSTNSWKIRFISISASQNEKSSEQEVGCGSE